MFRHITIPRHDSSYSDPYDRVEGEYEGIIVRKPDTEYPLSRYPWERYPYQVKSEKYTNISNY
jgi:hypothetical protein